MNIPVDIDLLAKKYEGMNTSKFLKGHTYNMADLMKELKVTKRTPRGKPRGKYEIMAERWVSIQLKETETLKCGSCRTYLYIQNVHLYLNVTDEIEEIMCDTCWKKTQKEERQ